jgi:hypothetical protein
LSASSAAASTTAATLSGLRAGAGLSSLCGLPSRKSKIKS